MSQIDRICADAGITYRQLDYWTRTGRLNPYGRFGGTGVPRNWPATEARVAVLMGKLIAAGFTLDGAHDAARKIVKGETEIAPGITVDVSAA